MQNYPINVHHRRIPPHIGDVVTPVSLYLTLRDLYPNTILLESSDYHGNNNSTSFICFDPMADFLVEGEQVTCRFPDKHTETTPLPASKPVTDLLQDFIDRLQVAPNDCPLAATGLYGYTTYDAVRYFENLQLKLDPAAPYAIPDMRYHLYRSVIAFNHFTNQLYLVEQDRKSTRLNSSHVRISYAVFCLKKKKTQIN